MFEVLSKLRMKYAQMLNGTVLDSRNAICTWFVLYRLLFRGAKWMVVINKNATVQSQIGRK